MLKINIVDTAEFCPATESYSPTVFVAPYGSHFGPQADFQQVIEDHVTGLVERYDIGAKVFYPGFEIVSWAKGISSRFPLGDTSALFTEGQVSFVLPQVVTPNDQRKARLAEIAFFATMREYYASAPAAPSFSGSVNLRDLIGALEGIGNEGSTVFNPADVFKRLT